MKEILKSKKTITGGWRVSAKCQTLSELRAARDQLDMLVRANEKAQKERRMRRW